MKITQIILAVVLFAAGNVRALDAAIQDSSTAELTRLVAGSRWFWYFGNLKGSVKRVTVGIEFHNDGTARVPWEPQAQLWAITAPNTLSITGVGPKGRNYIFTMDAAKKAGDQVEGLHIRYDKKLPN